VTTIVIDSPERLAYAQKVLSRLPLDKNGWDCEITSHRERRTVNQNRRLWLLHTKAAEHTGYSPEEMHEHALCRHYGYTEKELIDPLTGEVWRKRIPLKRSSTRNTKEFGEFMESTEAWYISEFGVFLGDEA